MPLFDAILVLLASLLPGATVWEQPREGLEYRRFEHAPAAEPGDLFPTKVATLHVFRFSPGDYELRVLPAPEGRGATVATLGREHGALLAVNGGYFLEDFRPLGLLVSQGVELNPLRPADWGVFSVARGVARLVHRRDWARPEGLDFAIEAGPRLVVDGAPLSLKPQRARRSALGIDARGRVLVVATADALHTSQLARFLAAPEREGGLACRLALNLDGGSSTQLWFAHGGRRVEIPALGPVANAVALFPRDEPRPPTP